MAKKPTKRELAELKKQEEARQSVLGTLGTAVFLFAIAGIVCFFLKLYNITVICACLTILNTLLQLMVGGQRDFAIEIAAVIIGLLAARFARAELSTWIYFVSVALCFGDALLQILGWTGAMMIKTDGKKGKGKKK